jgi:hypothetical protein
MRRPIKPLVDLSLISVTPWGFLPQNPPPLPVQKPLGVFLLAAAAIQRRRGRREEWRRGNRWGTEGRQRHEAHPGAAELLFVK